MKLFQTKKKKQKGLAKTLPTEEKTMTKPESPQKPLGARGR